MQNKKEANKELSITLAIVLVFIVVGVLVFISIKNKTESSPETSSLSYGENGVTGGDTEKINMQTNGNSENTSEQGGANPQTVDKGGVKITVLREGSGKVAKAGNSVSMNYTGTLTNGTVFDSNVDPKFHHVEPFTFNLGAGQVIKGWDVGVEGMKEGEKRKLEIAPEYGYGAGGIPGAIPGNATLIFEVELLKVN
jgi:FKBP-type peptidyl-prolyl cis-trans isomerase